MKKITLALLLLVAVAGGTAMKWNMVREVVDGDTITLGNGKRVRLLGIDAPDVGLCGGEEAKKELEELTLGKLANLSEIDVDYFKRLLAIVRAGGKNINEEMLKSGWVRWDGTENGLGKLFRSANNEAKYKKLGIYGKCREPDNPKCIIKGTIENRSKTPGESERKFYYFPGCSEYESVLVEKELGEKWFCTEDEALAEGYQKATHCYDKVYTKLK